MDLENLTDEDRIAVVTARVHREFHKEYKPQELYQRVLKATKAIGIDDVVVKEWDRNTLDSGMTDAVVRESRYNNGIDTVQQNIKTDIGYFKFRIGKTITSFHINDRAFSDEKYAEFSEALRKEGLAPSPYYTPCGPLFYTEEDIEREKQRKSENNPIYK